jgi:hypothetical protein
VAGDVAPNQPAARASLVNRHLARRASQSLLVVVAAAAAAAASAAAALLSRLSVAQVLRRVATRALDDAVEPARWKRHAAPHRRVNNCHPAAAGQLVEGRHKAGRAAASAGPSSGAASKVAELVAPVLAAAEKPAAHLEAAVHVDLQAWQR